MNRLHDNNGKLRLLSLFSGIGAFERALENIGYEYEVVKYCEIDKFASKAYSLMHDIPEELNLWDITKVDDIPSDIDMITYGFPCQDISIIGHQKGFKHDGKFTRSGLFFEALRIIEKARPKYAIAENVKNLLSNRFEREFQTVLLSLDDAGYNSYWKVINAKEFGIPQDRERVIIVSIRKDVDDYTFRFPEPIPLATTMKNLLEDSIDEKYFLKGTQNYFIRHSFDTERMGHCFKFEPHVKNHAGIAKTITTKAGVRITDNYIVDIDCEMPKFAFRSNNPYIVFADDMVYVKTEEQVLSAYVGKSSDSLRIRKLTPKECFRLMGFTDEDVDILQANGISDTQLYKLAGNSIVVNVLEKVFMNLLVNRNQPCQNLFLIT